MSKAFIYLFVLWDIDIQNNCYIHIEWLIPPKYIFKTLRGKEIEKTDGWLDRVCLLLSLSHCCIIIFYLSWSCWVEIKPLGPKLNKCDFIKYWSNLQYLIKTGITKGPFIYPKCNQLNWNWIFRVIFLCRECVRWIDNDLDIFWGDVISSNDNSSNGKPREWGTKEHYNHNQGNLYTGESDLPIVQSSTNLKIGC
jgi:hypothetical protein